MCVGRCALDPSCCSVGRMTLVIAAVHPTWSNGAGAAGKSVKWVADQLGHSSPMLTLKTYAHAMREEEVDLSFATFGDGSERLYPAPTKKGADEELANPLNSVVELRGIEPLTLRLPA